MNEFDKAELLKTRANVSFEEARDALRACGGDLLDALVYLERLGHVKKTEKTAAPAVESVRTEPVYMTPSVQPVQDIPSFWTKLGQFLGSLVKKSMENYVVVSHEGVVKFRISIFLFVILFMIFHAGLFVAMVVSLFFGVKYSFAGKDDLSRVSEAIGRVGDRATEWWGTRRYTNPEIENLCRKYDAQDDQNR